MTFQKNICLLLLTWVGIGSPVLADDLVARTSPDWLRSGTIYEIFPRDFSVAGNIAGVTAKLDELHDLGVTILWTMPIHPIGEKFRKGGFGSPYSIRDYYAVDPNYGTLDDYKKFVVAAHQRGMKVIMDLVANHTAWDSVMLEAPKLVRFSNNTGRGMMFFLHRQAELAANSSVKSPIKLPRPDFYKHDDGHVIPPVPTWTDVAGLNYQNPELRQYMIAMLKYWIKECDVDGFRCDVAYMVPTDFWEQVRTELTKVKPDIMMLAEASKPELLTNAFDIDYSWPLLATLNDVLLRNAPATNIRQSWEDSLKQFPKNSLHMRISDDHDEARAVARYGIQGALAASALMFTLDGVPLIYNGMEVGDATESGDPALFDKLNIFWNPKERPALQFTYHDLIKLRKDYPAFTNDRLIWLPNFEDNSVVTFMRLDANDEFVVAVNLSSRPVTTSLKVLNAAEFQPVKIAGRDTPTGNLPRFQLPGYGWQIWHRATGHGETTAQK